MLDFIFGMLYYPTIICYTICLILVVVVATLIQLIFCSFIILFFNSVFCIIVILVCFYTTNSMWFLINSVLYLNSGKVNLGKILFEQGDINYLREDYLLNSDWMISEICNCKILSAASLYFYVKEYIHI